ncbi:hypothetical protein LguiB_009124 [Lonicera macranthoides]
MHRKQEVQLQESHLSTQLLLKKNPTMNHFPLCLFIILAFLALGSNSQQLYSGTSVLDCNGTDEAGPSPDFLYTCNSEKKSCQAFLIFRSQSPYDSLVTISNLTSSDLTKLTHANNIASNMLLPQYKEVIVPVTCSCSGQYYQANTSYVVETGDNYFTIAFNTYQGLSTCDSLMKENIYSKFNLIPGSRLRVPLRCACPTSNQILNGTKFLLTYLAMDDDSVPKISESFNVSSQSVAFANGFLEEDSSIDPLTTLLIPLPEEPLSSQTKIHPPSVVSSPPTHRNPNRNSKKGLLIGIGAGFLLVVLCSLLSVVFFRHRWKKSYELAPKKRERKRKWVLPEHLQVAIAGVDQILKVYEFEELEAATENFSLRNKLSASVYRGVLREKVVAIKKMSLNIAKEVKILNKINHFNLISLYGACENQGVFYLVYEFMEIGSLKEWLIKESDLEIRGWNFRIQIALDIAKGLHYIHNFTNPAYVHKGINSSNVLLNRELRAKIANFSLAKSSERDENGTSSTRCDLGAKGYMAPEYLESCEVTTKMDVYAFGIVLLELITGKEAVFKQDGEEVMLSEVVLSSEADLSYLVDPRLQVKHALGYIIDRTGLVIRMMKLSIACLELEPSRRLSMGEVVSTLMKIQIDAQESESLSME